MPKFATRIDLYGNPTHEILQLLQESMEAANFNHTVEFCGILYMLPAAEYIWEGSESIKAIEALAVKTVEQVWKDFGVMITKTEDAFGFHNLKPADLQQKLEKNFR